MENIPEIFSTYDFTKLEDKIQFELDGVVEKESKNAYSAENLEFCVSCIDYTTLKVTDTQHTVSEFVGDLLKKMPKYRLPQVAAICVYPQYASIVRKSLNEMGIKTAAVSGAFPSAQSFMEVKLKECEMAIKEGAQEIDVVLSVGDILENNYEKVYKELSAIRKVCKDVALKVILETGELKSIENIFNSSLISMYAGADFIKTSTGKVPVNATPEAVYIMCDAIRQYYTKEGRKVGIKVSGGITKAHHALRYMSLINHVLGEEWLTPQYARIGASQLLDDIVKEIKNIRDKEKVAEY